MKPFFDSFRSTSIGATSLFRKQKREKRQSPLATSVTIPPETIRVNFDDDISPTTAPNNILSPLEELGSSSDTAIITTVGPSKADSAMNTWNSTNNDKFDSTNDIFWEKTKAMPFYFDAYSLQPMTKKILLQNPVIDKLLEAHIKELHDRAWRLFPYPCIGMYEYVRFNLPSYPLYRELLEILRSGGKYLDIGCCFGQDIRYLRAQPGIDPFKLYGAELRQEFIDMGYDLFVDRETLPSKISQADIFDDASWMYSELSSSISIIHISYVLHLFDYAKQVDMVKRMMRLLDRKPGSMIVGKSVGSEVAGLYHHPTVGEMYRHSLITFRELWEKHSGCNVAVYLHIGKERRISADGKQLFEHPPTERAVEIEFCILVVE